MSLQYPGGVISATYNPLAQALQVDYMVVAGGGAGGGVTNNAAISPGGGAGGILIGYNYDIRPGIAYTATVGAGGAGVSADRGGNGGDSSWNTSAVGGGSTITSTGGGGGGGAATNTGGNGGSGGGGYGSAASGTGVSGQGNAGSAYIYASGSGGGGGAGSQPRRFVVNATAGYSDTKIMHGGAGIYGFDGQLYAGGGAAGGGPFANYPNSINVSLVSFGGKGGGANCNPGTGYVSSSGNLLGNAGEPGTGGGGSGVSAGFTATNMRALPGGNGGGGAVVVRTLASLNPAVSVTGSPVVRIIGNYRYYYFYATGTITF